MSGSESRKLSATSKTVSELSGSVHRHPSEKNDWDSRLAVARAQREKILKSKNKAGQAGKSEQQAVIKPSSKPARRGKDKWALAQLGDGRQVPVRGKAGLKALPELASDAKMDDDASAIKAFVEIRRQRPGLFVGLVAFAAGLGCGIAMSVAVGFGMGLV